MGGFFVVGGRDLDTHIYFSSYLLERVEIR